MKYLLVLLTLFTVNASFAQETKNFKIVNGGLVWQKVYESKDSITRVASDLKKDGIIKNIEIIDSTITGTTDDLYADYRGAGFSRGVTPMFLLSQQILCTVLVNFKEGKYRVTIKNMKVRNTLETPISKVGETEPFETFVLRKKNTEFRPAFLNASATILDHTFNNIFESKKDVEKDDNW